MFTQSRTVAFSRKVNCTVEKALTILHNPIDLIDLNPLVVHREQSATDPALWNIRDRLSTLGLKYEFNYTARATPLEDGALFEINAPLGIVLRNKWTVTPAGEGVVEMKEDVEVITNCLLMSSVLRDLKKAHEVMHDTLAAQMEGRSVDAKKAPQPSGEQSVPPYFAVIPLLFALLCHFLSEPSWTRTALCTVLAATVPFLARGASISSSDPYGSFHVALNVSDDNGREGKIPDTEWLNMGYWKDTQSFPKACEALALRLLSVAECQPGGNVLDVGHGSGDSLLLHLRHPSVPRPSHLTGITSLKAHYTRSLERVEALGAADIVTLYHSDAVYRPSAELPKGESHPLDPSSSSALYTTILALDCAYHFRTRHDFLVQSYEHLADGGKLVLADICFSSEASPGFGSGIVKRAIGLLGVMPKANMVTITEYAQDLRAIGFEDVAVEDITGDVFPGFEMFLAKRGGLWPVFASSIGLLSAAGARFVIISGQKSLERLDRS